MVRITSMEKTKPYRSETVRYYWNCLFSKIIHKEKREKAKVVMQTDYY